MGQSNTKHRQQQQQQQTPAQERRRRSKQPDLTIQPQATFDSHFTLISPMSELSDPSQFLPKRSHYNQVLSPSNVPPSLLEKHQNKNKIVMRNVPPLPPELQGRYKPTEQPPPIDANRPLLRKKKNKKKKQVKEAFAGCAIVTSEHADRMRVATTENVTACVKKTGNVEQENGVARKCGLAALNCVKATRAVAAGSADVLALTVTNSCARSQVGSEEQKYKNMSNAARCSLGVVDDSNCVGVHPPVGFQPVWRESRGMLPTADVPSNPIDAPRGAQLQEDTTPLAQLDRAFAATVGLHSEDDYFDRLAGPAVAQSPFVAREVKTEVVLPATSQYSPVNVSLFSTESSVAKLDTSDLDFARESYQPKWQRMSDYDVTPRSKHVPFSAPISSPVVLAPKVEKKQLDQREAAVVKHSRTNDERKAVGRPSVESSKQDFEVKPHSKVAKKTSVEDKRAFSKNIFRPKTSVDTKSSKQHATSKKIEAVLEVKGSFESLRLTESAPSVMQGQDYRNIAWSTSEGAASAPTQPQYYSVCSPSGSSTSSNGEQSRGPLLTTQTLSNAAFLFSSSYGGEERQLLNRQQPARDPAFSISTFASRARLSSVSSRSRPAITIPVSKSWESSLTTAKEEIGYDFSGVDRSNKHVRFSDADQTQYNQIANNARQMKNEAKRAALTRNLPEKIATPAIETKMSDLTDASMLNRKVSFDETSITTATSGLSIRSERRDNSPTASSVDCSEQDSPMSSSHDIESTTSSKTPGSVHWTYREENGKVTTTPNLGKKRSTAHGTLPTTSPMVRFRAAKDKFAHPSEKVVPNKRTPPKKFFHRSPRKTLVSNYINTFDARLTSTRQPESKNPRRDTSGHRVLAPHRANLVNPIFRTPATTNLNDMPITRNETSEETPFDEAEEESEDRFAKLVLSNAEVDINTSMSIADTDVSDDPFAEIMRSNSDYGTEPEVPGAPPHDPFAEIMKSNSDYGTEPEVSGDSSLRRVTSGSINSVYSFASHGSSVKPSDVKRHRISTGNFDQENSVSLNYLHKMSVGRSQVNPADVYKHDNPAHLCLSPTQRTPMQARKWRTLAAAAHEKEKNKKSTVKRGHRKGLSERSINVL